MDPFALPTFDLALASAGLRLPAEKDVRWLMEFARSCGYDALQVNAADPATRPRDLSRSGRRDLAAHLRRHELSCSGVDLWIPRPHFSDQATIDRAVAALLDAIDFASDLAELTGGQRVLSTLIPSDTARGVIDAIAERALATGVEVANHAYPWSEESQQAAALAIGLDPSAVILAGEDPAAAVSSAAGTGRLASVRLSDLAESGRVMPGEGALEPLAYRVAVATSGYTGPLVVDLRGLPSGSQQGGQLAIAQSLCDEFGHRSLSD